MERNNINSRLLAIYIINRVMHSKSYADMLLDFCFKKYDLQKRDKHFITEIVYGVLRWKKQLDWILQHAYRSEWGKVPNVIKRALEIGLYQIIYMDKVPDYASVNESVKIAVENKGLVWGKVVNGVLREVIRNPKFREMPPLDKNSVKALSIKWSHPEWLIKRWIEDFGVKRTDKLCEANNQRPVLNIRVNRLLTDRDSLIKEFSDKEIFVKKSSFSEDFLIAEKAGNLAALDLFNKGNFTIQDISAGLPSYLIAPEAGEVILDMASAPGGKSTHMAELSQDKAIIIACDLHPVRIAKVLENKNRLNLQNIYALLSDSRNLPIKKNVDKILLDAPCSGFGVMRRKSEIRWHRNEEHILKCVKLQKELLKSAAEYVKPGGIIVYSTCTIMPEENAQLIKQFLSKNSNFKIENGKDFVNPDLVTEEGFIETWPDKHNIDGSFAVRLKKKM